MGVAPAPLPEELLSPVPRKILRPRGHWKLLIGALGLWVAVMALYEHHGLPTKTNEQIADTTVGVALLLFFVGSAVGITRSERKHYALRVHGTAIAGEITSLFEDREDRTLDISYRFAPSDGETIAARVILEPWDRNRIGFQPEVGCSVVVLFDPTDPARHFVWGLSVPKTMHAMLEEAALTERTVRCFLDPRTASRVEGKAKPS